MEVTLHPQFPLNKECIVFISGDVGSLRYWNKGVGWSLHQLLALMQKLKCNFPFKGAMTYLYHLEKQ